MGVKLYMDVHIRCAVTQGLRLRGVDVVTAQEDGTEEPEEWINRTAWLPL
ncbi:MAG TPA: hypothetical protein VJ810_28590 [Blastocatellia bacterium]|nr:hypothetical protein [Blastocatellia bacterium]